LIVLSFTAVVGTLIVSNSLGRWAAFPSEPLPIAVVFYGIGFCILPAVAMFDIFRLKISGRYLALFSMMITMGLVLRVLSHQLIMPMSGPGAPLRAAMILPTFSVLIGMVTLIYSLGFGERANRFFDQRVTAI
jgi:hypothetical protein